jgi:hypothetical protein
VSGEKWEHYRHRMGVMTDHDWERASIDLERLRTELA